MPRIPTFKTTDVAGNTMEINDNEDKTKFFAKNFFPPPPEQQEANEPQYKYSNPLPDPQPPDKQQLEKIICRLTIQGPRARRHTKHSTSKML